MVQTVNGALYKSMIVSGAALLEKNKQVVNELNVFPVPDGDTGTNMSLTLNTGVTAFSNGTADTVTAVADVAASALLRGARGNSGVILSLLFRGMSKALKDHKEICALDFAAALTEGVSAAYKAVMRPTEGTMLTVSRVMAETASKYVQDEGEYIDELLELIIEAGKDALILTTDQNPVLKKAGVIDAGAQGYLFLIEGMLSAVRGEPVIADEEQNTPSGGSAFSVFNDEDITYTYCTEFIVNKENDKNPEILRDFCSGIGDSLVFVEDDDIIKVHVHTDAPGRVLTMALTFGSFVTVKIENMRIQHTAMIDMENSRSREETLKESEPTKKYGSVSVCAGEGMGGIFENLGVDVIVTGGQTMNPSTEDILEAVDSVPAETVFVLPNNKNIIMAAEQCIPLTGKNVVVIPTKTVAQGISAMISFDETMTLEELTGAMTDAGLGVVTAQITYAARDSEYEDQEIHAGEYLEMLDGAFVGSNMDLNVLIYMLMDRFAETDPEIITVYYGEDVSSEEANKVTELIAERFPDVDITTIDGGQPIYYYIISAE